jgi:glutaconate CoA-transferase subunit A
LPALNPNVREAADPFTGERVTQVRALALDLAIIHVPAVDSRGNAYVEGDFAMDGALARAARKVYVSHEQTVAHDPRRAVLSRLWVDATVSAAGGAWPTGCHPHYGADLDAVSRWAAEGASAGVELLTEAPR